MYGHPHENEVTFNLIRFLSFNTVSLCTDGPASCAPLDVGDDIRLKIGAVRVITTVFFVGSVIAGAVDVVGTSLSCTPVTIYRLTRTTLTKKAIILSPCCGRTGGGGSCRRIGRFRSNQSARFATPLRKTGLFASTIQFVGGAGNLTAEMIRQRLSSL
jgi:hypothetical protein